ncbi:TPA: site-specific DNA-methyltransferase [Legionella pneumophila]|nr:site-specific DNA-methyltransferase [Legionella pneumophila]HBZ2981805.1 site-specific DNA-methyltransferase [Legionella pneumophila]HBZ2988055.1 site-specific DNA-methyltransferase [Legionella pneumophila]HCE5547146.1 site-specific DNA-methyltransferase [Legionella pneumophila]HCE6185155.1 site-specific DNA-methyltransferase [Legionella pneumophila]HCJ1130879.1 site-specific DNA-methyltransferase [Legionella pneumophila]
MHSKDITEENIEKIGDLFPNCITEATDEQGRLRKKIDFDMLRQELSREIVEGTQERYQLNWPGKRQSLFTANSPVSKTLRPCLEESLDFENTKNLFIEGDNLDTLKILQETYLNKVKLIYIDPPYNTGKDFVYTDNFYQSVDSYLLESNQIDTENNKLVPNREYSGRYHSNWASMIYSRIKLARNLLNDDGVIFISIDDNELANLKQICNEIFGELNFVGQFVHKNNSIKNQATLVSVSTEYFLCYAKKIDKLKQREWRLRKKGAEDIANLYQKLKNTGYSIEQIKNEIHEMYKRPKYAHLSRWNKVDDIGVFKDADLSREGGRKDYTIINPETGDPCVIPARGWGKSEEELLKLQAENKIWYGNKDTPPGLKDYININDLSVPDSFWYFDNSVDTRWIKSEFNGLVFENPKPLEMIKSIIEMTTEEDDIILDFFGGSGTTGHAVLEINAQENSYRRYILVQLPEECLEKSVAYKQGYKTISEICKERLRRAGKKLKVENKDKDGIDKLDIGFRVFRVDSSNMTNVYYRIGTIDQDLVSNHIDNVKSDRTSEDLLFQVLLDWGVDLTLPIKKDIIQEHEVFFVDEDALVACFDNDGKITEEFVKELTQYRPLRVVFRDAGFASDSVKINVTQIFKQLSPHTDVKTI